MKKMIVALCAVALLGLTACEKDPEPEPNTNPTENPDNPGNTDPENPDNPDNPDPGNPDDPEMPHGEGIYYPGVHITNVSTNGANTETWTWDGSKLQSIMAFDNGAVSSNAAITYDGDRMKSIALTTTDLSGTFDLTYRGEYITDLGFTTGGVRVMDAEVQHNSDNLINLINVTIDRNYVDQLLPMLMSLMGSFGSGILNTAMQAVVPEVMRYMPEKRLATKASFDDVTFSAELFWTADKKNVRQVIIKAGIDGSVEASEIAEIASMLGGLGLSDLGDLSQLAQMSSLISGPIQIHAEIGDTIELSYDNMKNPVQWCLPHVGPSMLSANNVTEMISYGYLNGTATATVPVLGTQTIPLDYPLDNQNIDYEYEYNAAGYPTSYSTSAGEQTTYTFAQ